MNADVSNELNLHEWAVVIPTIRNVDPDRLRGLPPEVRLIVIDDAGAGLKPPRANAEVFTHDDTARVLGNTATLIPRRTDTCRSFGFFMAWRQQYKFIVTLDDDCCTQPGFLAHHSVVGQTVRLQGIGGRPWHNTLDNLLLAGGDGSTRAYARGFPYCLRNERPQTSTGAMVEGRVVCNLGLWTGVPDINGFDKLGAAPLRSTALRAERVALAPATATSLSSMNIAFLAEVVPAFYQLPMGMPLCTGRLDRLGDIWSGYILKRLADIRGDVVTLGLPLVEHVKLGDTIREARAEHYGHLLENYFYDLIDDASARVSAGDYARMYAALAEEISLRLQRIRMPTAYAEFFRSMAEKMAGWAGLFG